MLLPEISSNDKLRLELYLESNDLDYDIVDNGIHKYHVIAEDKIRFYLHTYENQYVIVKYDSSKELQTTDTLYQYFYFKTLPEVLEQLKFYDGTIHKTYWEPIIDSIQIGFDKDNHIDNWYNDIIREGFKKEDTDMYQYIVYENTDYRPEILSPFNTLHEVSSINDKVYTKLDKLYFEIHPISCLKKNESYLVKLLSNNDSIFKEYINYRVSKKRGLKLLIEDIFSSMEKFKITC